ncbi:Recombinase [Microbacterium paraoxydans]|uniref:Recombinase n=2 Tax=Microbacteriaceae TaxID=85023 RepID=A0A1H1PVJ1_9MICO|nr:Recombinase [Microbacterium paraoxydans]
MTAKRASILIRVSTEDQVDGSSLADQERLCRSLIEARGWNFTGRVYADEGVSGTVENRPALTEALRDAAKGEFEVLVALNMTRLSRKLHISAKVIDDLAELDVAFVSVQESFIDTTTSAGRAMAGVFSSFAQMDRDAIVEKTARGQRAKGEAGLWPGGHPPFGWRLEGHKRTAQPMPDERERQVLAEAYRLLVTQRLNAFQVAARLNDAGLKPRKADAWNPESLRRVLANETLATGILVWGAPSSGGLYPRSHKTKVKRDGTPRYGEPIRIELPEPPFTASQHRAIVRALASRSNRGKAASPISRPLTGQVFGACGMPYYGVTIKGKAPVMRCTGRRHLAGEAKCTCPQVAWEPLESRVWAAVVGFLSDPARLETMARQYLELPAEVGDGAQDATLLAAVERQIEKLERAQANAARELLLADNPAPIREALAQVERDLEGLRERREGYQALASSAQAKGEALRDLAALAERARGNLDRLTEDQRRQVYEILRVRVQMTGSIKADAHRVAHPEGLSVSGVLDPRLWGEEGRGGGSGGGNGDSGPRPMPSFPTPSNSQVSDDGRGRLRRSARGDHALGRGAGNPHRPRPSSPDRLMTGGVPDADATPAHRRWRGDRGAVAAELALALPAIVLVLLLGAGALVAASRQVALQDAAADAARLLGRGEDPAAAARVVHEAIPGAGAAFAPAGDLVCATATLRVSLGAVISVPLRASSCALDGGR